MKEYRRQKTERLITVETWVTQRQDWPAELSKNVDFRFVARGHCEQDGNMEWRYFETLGEANEWCDKKHIAEGNRDRRDILADARGGGIVAACKTFGTINPSDV